MSSLSAKRLLNLFREYDYCLCFFFAAESESNICFASSRLDLAVPELWIFAYLLKSENE